MLYSEYNSYNRSRAMNIIITNSSELPIFRQIGDAIKEAIFSNELKEEFSGRLGTQLRKRFFLMS